MLAGDDAETRRVFLEISRDGKGLAKGIAATNRETIVPLGLFPDGHLADPMSGRKSKVALSGEPEYLYLAIAGSRVTRCDRRERCSNEIIGSRAASG